MEHYYLDVQKQLKLYQLQDYVLIQKKIGVYFANNLKLAELMILEHSESLEYSNIKNLTEYISVYTVIDYIDIICDKYSKKSGSHYDNNYVYPIVRNELYNEICNKIIPENSYIAEIFLDLEDVKKIEYNTCWPISLNKIVEKYLK